MRRRKYKRKETAPTTDTDDDDDDDDDERRAAGRKRNREEERKRRAKGIGFVIPLVVVRERTKEKIFQVALSAHDDVRKGEECPGSSKCEWW